MYSLLFTCTGLSLVAEVSLANLYVLLFNYCFYWWAVYKGIQCIKICLGYIMAQNPIHLMVCAANKINDIWFLYNFVSSVNLW